MGKRGNEIGTERTSEPPQTSSMTFGWVGKRGREMSSSKGFKTIEGTSKRMTTSYTIKTKPDRKGGAKEIVNNRSRQSQVETNGQKEVRDGIET